MTDIKWTTEKRKIGELVFFDRNPRQMTEKQVNDLKNSLANFNLVEPIVINRNNRVIGGHQRLRILLSVGEDEVDVRIPDVLLTERQEEELNLRLNKNIGDWDWDMLSGFDETLLNDVGFADELDRIMGRIEPNEKEFDENIGISNKCPKCGYEW